jgi:uncharacterized protein YchJ
VKTINRRIPFITILGLIVIFLAAGCAGLSPSSSDAPASLEDRVKAYMQAQIDGDWNKAHAFLNAASRDKTPREKYIHQTRQATYTGYEVVETAVLPSGEQAKVKVKIDVSFMGYELKGAPHNQTWVKENGQWFVDLYPQSTPFDAPKEQAK